MGIGDILELLLTFGVLLVIWGVPRLALSARGKRRGTRRDGSGGRSRGKQEPHPAAESPEMRGSADSYDRDEQAAAGWLERQRSGTAGGEAAAALYTEPPEPESLLSTVPAAITAPRVPRHGKLRRRELRRAIIWKEILDRPKALRLNPFEDRAGSA